MSDKKQSQQDTLDNSERHLQTVTLALESGTRAAAIGMINALHPSEVAQLLE